MYKMMGAIAGAAALAWASTAAAAEVELPGTLVMTAYDVGSSGYSQMVGLGSILKNNYGTNVRVLPGKNDVSRLGPVKAGRAQFTATGSDSVYAQEAVFTFGSREWGPQPLRVHALSLGKGAAVGMVTPGDKSIETIGDIRGKRVAWIRGAPALNKAVESMMACAGVTWDDVEKVEFGGHGPAVDGFINNEVDALNNATFSALNKKIEASPRGIYYPRDPERSGMLEADQRGRALVQPGVRNGRHRYCRGRPVDAERAISGAGVARQSRPENLLQRREGDPGSLRHVQGFRTGRAGLGSGKPEVPQGRAVP